MRDSGERRGQPAGAAGMDPRAQPPPAAAPMAAAPVAAVPARRGLSPIVWVLIIVGGLFVLGGVVVVGGVFFAVHKVKQAGLDPQLMQRNPGYAIAKLAITANPDVEEVSHDEAAGTITVREKKTGKVTTMKFGDLQNGHFSFSARDDNGQTATMEFGEGANVLHGCRFTPAPKRRASFPPRAAPERTRRAVWWPSQPPMLHPR